MIIEGYTDKHEYISPRGVKSTVYLMDCMEGLKQIPKGLDIIAVVDPPYGLGESVVNSGGRFKRYYNENGNWDKSIPTDQYFNDLFNTTKNQIIWGGNYFALPPNKCFIIWDKLQPIGISFAMAEYAWTSFDKVAKICKHRTQGQEQRFHPTQKPIYLYSFIFKHFSEQSDIILDTHLGSQSSRIAADMANLEFIGFELDSDYFRDGCKRFDNYTKQLKLEL